MSDSLPIQFLDDGTGPVSVAPEAARAVIIPVPLEKTVSYLTGTASGPEGILRASAQVELYDPELDLSPFQYGLYTVAPLDCSAPLEEILERLRSLAEERMRAGQKVVCLGGEHSLSLAPIQAARRLCPGLSVLHLDAHADLRNSYGGSPHSHACVMRRVLETGAKTVSVGVRSLSRPEMELIREKRLRLYPAWRFRSGSYPWDEIVSDLSEEVYLTVDLDVFDPSAVPGVGTPEPGGLGWDDALEMGRALRSAGRNVVGFDIVELCPRPGSIVSEFFAARLLYKLIGCLFSEKS